ncbi:MAG: hypothetical protein WCC73_10040, partial [Terracidiphilus sp.]
AGTEGTRGRGTERPRDYRSYGTTAGLAGSWLLAAAGVAEAAAVAAIDGAGGLGRGGNERKNSGGDQSEFDEQGNHWNPQGAAL